jgi:hypothetical protein
MSSLSRELTAEAASSDERTGLHPVPGRGAVRFHLVCAFVVLSVLTVSQRFADPDLWLHLKVGETIWQTRTIPGHDLFSYTASGQAYPAHEWLGQLMMYVFYRMGGYVGVMLWLCVLASAVVVGLYVLCALYSGDHMAGLIGAAVGWFFGTVGFTPRPALLGFLFLVLELLLLELGRTRSRRWLWGLPPLFALWVNCHGSFYIGLGVLGVAVACTLVPWKGGQIEVPLWTRAARRTLLSAGACMALQHMRLAFAFGVFAGPVVARTLARLMGPERETRNRRWVNPALFAASVAIIAIAFPGQAALERQVTCGIVLLSLFTFNCWMC